MEKPKGFMSSSASFTQILPILKCPQTSPLVHGISMD